MEDLEQNLIDADERAAKAAKAYSEHVFTWKLFESHSKDMLASLKFKIKKESGQKISDAELEMLARASDEWKVFRSEQMKQLKEAGKAQIAYDNAQRRWDTQRSILSVRKTEVKRFGG